MTDRLLRCDSAWIKIRWGWSALLWVVDSLPFPIPLSFWLFGIASSSFNLKFMFSEALTVSLFHFLFCSLFADKERNRKKTFSVGYHPNSVSLRFVKWVHLLLTPLWYERWYHTLKKQNNLELKVVLVSSTSYPSRSSLFWQCSLWCSSRHKG